MLGVFKVSSDSMLSMQVGCDVPESLRSTLSSPLGLSSPGVASFKLVPTAPSAGVGSCGLWACAKPSFCALNTPSATTPIPCPCPSHPATHTHVHRHTDAHIHTHTQMRTHRTDTDAHTRGPARTRGGLFPLRRPGRKCASRPPGLLLSLCALQPPGSALWQDQELKLSPALTALLQSGTGRRVGLQDLRGQPAGRLRS